MGMTKINLACGGTFVAEDGWINLDYSPASPAVQRADLLGRLPLADATAGLVYCSHFLEHIPRSRVPGFLAECYRVLTPNGVLRLVLPDLDNLCRAYLTHREHGEHEKADFVLVEMIDQCVRRESGGELGRMYRRFKEEPEDQRDLINFVRERTGENLLASLPPCSLTSASGGLSRLVRKAQGRIERLWTRGVLYLLPTAFRAQNVSLAGVGERHHWLWDSHQIRQVLETAGFVAIERAEASISRCSDFPFQPLDLDSDLRPRKGAGSMYIEAQKPQ